MEKLKAIHELAKPIMTLLETEDPYIKVLIDDNEVRTIRIEGSVKKQEDKITDTGVNKKNYVKVPLSNFCFADIIEQRKFEQMKNNTPNEAIAQIEALLKNDKVVISFESDVQDIGRQMEEH